MTRQLSPLWVVVLWGCASFPAAEPWLTVSDGRYVMGTVLEVILRVHDEAQGRAALADLFAEAERLSRLLTVYDADSALSRLNANAGSEGRPADPDLVRLLRRSSEFSKLTDESFDVTIGPLVELWMQAAARNVVPNPRELALARERVGWRHVQVGGDGVVRYARSGVVVNLGGIAKGYALDRMLPVLERHGIENALLSFGQSSTWAVGRPDDAPRWRLLARGPGDVFVGVLNLEDQALSVSANLGQWVEIGGKRYGHVIDPRSGDPLGRRRQALVVAPDSTLAEALSTALLVLGAEDGIALVTQLSGCEALLLDADGASWRTPGWNDAVGFERLPSP